MRMLRKETLLAVAFLAATAAASADPAWLPGPRELTLYLVRDAEARGLPGLTYGDVQEKVPALTPEVFHVLDQNQDGTVSRGDVLPRIAEPPGERLWFVLLWVDSLGIETADYEGLSEIFPQLPRAVFNQLDRNGDGELTVDDYPPAFEVLADEESGSDASDLAQEETASMPAKSLSRAAVRPRPVSPEKLIDSRELMARILRDAESKRAGEITFEAAQSVLPELTVEEFDALDRTKDGVLTLADMPRSPIPVLNRHRKELLHLLVTGDRYGQGFLEYTEIAHVFPDAPAELMFLLDTKGDGVVTRSELWKALGVDENGETLVPVQDVNADGVTNSIDIQITVNHALGRFNHVLPADIDESGRVNASDIQTVIRAALQVD